MNDRIEFVRAVIRLAKEEGLSMLAVDGVAITLADTQKNFQRTEAATSERLREKTRVVPEPPSTVPLPLGVTAAMVPPRPPGMVTDDPDLFLGAEL